jgi:type II secretory pathway pseudopilin PulG
VLDVRLQGKAVQHVTAYLAIVAVGIVCAIAIAIARSVMGFQQRRREFFEAAARRLGGTYQQARLARRDVIEFPLDGVTARVEFRPPGEDDQGGTQLLVPMKKPPPGTLHILPEGFGQSFLKMFGAQDLSVGDPAFDDAYVVKATPESFVFRVFAPDRRSRVIRAVRQLEGMSHPTIEVGWAHLRVQVREEVRSEGRLVGLVNTAKEFLEALRLDSEIEFGDLAMAKDSTCPVCGTGLDDLVVRCEICKTPHHVECWKYVGQCSTYACAGKRFVA